MEESGVVRTLKGLRDLRIGYYSGLLLLSFPFLSSNWPWQRRA